MFDSRVRFCKTTINGGEGPTGKGAGDTGKGSAGPAGRIDRNLMRTFWASTDLQAMGQSALAKTAICDWSKVAWNQ